MKQINQYFKNHPTYSATIHAIAGIGIGILITYPFVGAHPVRWGLSLLVIGIIGHIYPLMQKH